MVINNKTIAIIGGGPGGLTLARLLQMQQANVKVYERDFNKDVRVQGATLDLHEESGLQALRQAELIRQFYELYRPEAGKLRVADKYANIRLDEQESGEENHHRPEIDRGPLRHMLLGSLRQGTVVWDSHFIKMEKENDGWRLHFKNNTTAYADIVIAADGANSKIRSYLTDIQPVYSGITIVEGNLYDAAQYTPELYTMVNGGKVFAFGDEQSLILSQKGDGSLAFYTGCKTKEDWVTKSGIDFSDTLQVLAWFREAFGSWDPVWQTLFNAAKIWFVPRPQYHYPLDQQWITQSNLTMLGDAAHRMPPYAGEGVNMAMQDALELANCLCSNEYHSTTDAIHAYEAGMLQRSSNITRITLESTEMLHAADPFTWMRQLFEGQD